MKAMRIVALSLAAMSVIGASAARADVVLPFSVQGLTIYTQSSPLQTGTPFTATVLINTTTGVIQDYSRTTMFGTFSDIVSVRQGPVSGSNTYSWSGVNGFAPNSTTLIFLTPSLIDYTGGLLATTQNPGSAGEYSSITEVHIPQQVFISGSVTPLSVPEPSSLAVLAVSAFGLATLQAWRSRQTRSRGVGAGRGGIERG